MKTIINGKLYDTATAKCVASDSYSNPRDFRHWEEDLYQKKNGEFFLCGEGGPMSHYSEQTGCNQWSGGSAIIPYTEQEAKEWLEEHNAVDAYIELFGVPEE